MMNEKGMEMPIAVMIVFFVSIAVALIVINFAGEMIGMGQTQLRQFTLQSDEADFFIETGSVGSGTVARLADQCYKKNTGGYGGNKICYIAHAETEVGFSDMEVINQFLVLNPGYDPATMGDPISFEKWHENPLGRTVYIVFDEVSQAISIES